MKVEMFAAVIMCVGSCLADITIPDGTRLRVRLDHPISSATAEVGQAVELTVAEPVKINDVVAIKEGTRVTGTITEAVPKRRMGRAGKLDFSIDRVNAVDGQWVPLRYSLQKKSGESHAVRTGIITAGVAFAFPLAAPAVLLMKGKDITINRGQNFDVFTDAAHVIASAPPPASKAAPAPSLQSAAPAPPSPSGSASVTVTASTPGADIEVNGAFMGNTPTTLQLAPGSHQVTVKSGQQSWVRTIQVTGGSTVSLYAVLSQTAPVAQIR